MSIRRTPGGRAAPVCVALLMLVTAPAVALTASHRNPAAARSTQPGLEVVVRPATGLYPGARRPLTVTFRNNRTFDVLLRSVTTSSPGFSGCPAAGLLLATYELNPAVRIRHGRSVTRTVPFGMRSTAAPECQARHVAVRVTGRVARP